MEAMRVVKMKNGKFAIQYGSEIMEDTCTHMEWSFESEDKNGKWVHLYFEKEDEADAYLQKWINENCIAEIRTEVYINEEK